MLDILKLNSISPLAQDILDGYNLTDYCQNPVGILVRSFKMDEYNTPSSLIAVARAGAGVNNIPHADYAKKGICVFNTPGANANAVKELAVLAMLLGARNVAESIRWADTLCGDDVAKQVEKGKSSFVGSELCGKTLCIVGLGAIGRKVAKIAHALDMSVVGYDPHVSPDSLKELDFLTIYQDVKYAYQNADFISLHIPYIPQTKHFINYDSLKDMKNGVIIINTARGELVDNNAIKMGIANNIVRKYVVDFPNEECIGHDGIIAIPHLGASTLEAEDNCAIMASNQLKDYIENGNIVNSVNMPNLTLKKSKLHRASVIEVGYSLAPINGVSATRNGIRYTLIESDEPININDIVTPNTVKSRIIY